MVQILQENLMTQTEFIFKVNLTMNWSPQQGGGAPPTLGTTRLSFGAMTTYNILRFTILYIICNFVIFVASFFGVFVININH